MTGAETLMALAVDHRSQFEEMAERCGADPGRIEDFKLLALRAAEQVADRREGFGTLLDSRFGQKAIDQSAGNGLWIGRPVEQPGSRPLEFETGPDVEDELAKWPVQHVVKCLVFYHPDDPEDLRRRQEDKVLTLFNACRHTGHDLLLEIIAGKHGELGDDTVARAMQRFYDLGVYPSWWKLEPFVSDAAWAAVGSVITENDPDCRGVVVLGLDAPMDTLKESLRIAAGHDVVRGFAVGRTIFGDLAEQWLKGETDDADAVKVMAGRFGSLAESWMKYSHH